MVMCQLWDLKVQIHLLKLLGEFDRAALPLLSCLQFIFRLLNGAYFVCARTRVLLLVVSDC
jgi:hypothetical protein